MNRASALLAVLFVPLVVSSVRADDENPHAKWEPAIAKFEAADAKEMPPKGAVLFVGSSSIRLWDLPKSFPKLETINRGFGGSEVADSVHFADRIVTKYAPRTIVLYAGDNDVAKGKSAETVHADFRKFVKVVRAKLPGTRIVYVAIKPSLKRWNLVETMRDANARIAKDCGKDAKLAFADIDTPMLGDDGKPRADLFVEDGLHLSAKGYEVWTKVVAPLIDAPSRKPSTDARRRPNILFVMTDDQAPWAVGRWKGHTHADTPHLDRLFGQGAYLPNTFVITPVCSPSRAALACSRYGSELGITDWLNPRKEPEHGLDPATTTWYEAIQDAGYHTGLVGKWHLGLTDAHHPTRTGFDHFMGHRGGGWSPDNPTLEKDGKDRRFEGLTTDILTDHAIAFLEDRPTDRPFLLVLHYRAPHARWLPVADADWAPFENLDPELPHPDYPGLDTARAKRMTREYLASVRGVDRNVGRLMGTLDDLGLSENTVVVYTADHGYNMGHNGIWHKGNGHWVTRKDAQPPATEHVPKGQRPNMYDASLKVPTAVRWPGVIEPETTIEHSVTFLDWYPTLVGLAGGRLPEGEAIRGRDLRPLLRGQAKDWDDDVYTEYSTKHQSRTHMRCYRTPEWKLVRDFLDPKRDELFDLANDPEETRNVIADPTNAAVVKRLHAKIVERMRAIDDPVLKAVD